jgi:hypothetical protein
MAVKELSLSWAYAFADRVITEIRSPGAPDCVLDFLNPDNGDFLSKAATPCRDTLLHDIRVERRLLVVVTAYAVWE